MEALKNTSHHKDISTFLWLLKLGAVVNGVYFISSLNSTAILSLKIPAQIFFLVSAFRCLFPVSYPQSTVFHNSVFSSVFLTRFLATFSEIAMIFQLSVLMRHLNIEKIFLINALSWFMVMLVILSQVCVWTAIIFNRKMWYFYEEIGWFIIYSINTMVSLFLLSTLSYEGGKELLLFLNIIFGAGYLPWQFFHLKSLLQEGNKQAPANSSPITPSWKLFILGVKNSISVKNCSQRSEDWGGIIGVTWMAGYWAVIMPAWIYLIMKWG